MKNVFENFGNKFQEKSVPGRTEHHQGYFLQAERKNYKEKKYKEIFDGK
jgi:hypothetical protein